MVSKTSARSEQTSVKKGKAFERKVIPIPVGGGGSNDGSEVDEDDAQFFQSVPQSVNFLTNLDVNAIARFVYLAFVELAKPLNLRIGVNMKAEGFFYLRRQHNNPVPFATTTYLLSIHMMMMRRGIPMSPVA